MTDATPNVAPTLHGYFRSAASWRVRIALALKGVLVRQVFHHLRRDEQRAPPYLALNPQGLLPALELADGTVLTQSGISRISRAVVAGLDEHTGGTQTFFESQLCPSTSLPLIPAGLAVVQVLPAPERVTIVTQPQSAVAPCPDCGTVSRRIHSHYERLLGDLPWQGRPTLLRVQARRFRCLDPSCFRQTFAERLPGVAFLVARRTERLGSLQGCLGLALGGEAGQRLAERLAMPISADTLLRMARQAGNANEPPPTPRVLAVDD